MLTISFYPEYDRPEFINAAKEYQEVWDKEREKIVATIQKVSGLIFLENHVNAIVSNYPAYSSPLRFRFNTPFETRKATIIHELCHRLLSYNKVVTRYDDPNRQMLENHKQLNLIFFEILVELYGMEYANSHVVVESGYQPLYKEAWDWALNFSKNERAEKFRLSLKIK